MKLNSCHGQRGNRLKRKHSLENLVSLSRLSGWFNFISFFTFVQEVVALGLGWPLFLQSSALDSFPDTSDKELLKNAMMFAVAGTGSSAPPPPPPPHRR
jgi:hypothetical protein